MQLCTRILRQATHCDFAAHMQQRASLKAGVASLPLAEESKTSRCMESGGHVSPIGSEQNPRTLPAAARQLEKRCATVTGSPQHVSAKMHAAPGSRAKSMGAESARSADSSESVGKAGRGAAARPPQPGTGPGGFPVGSSWRNLSDAGSLWATILHFCYNKTQ